MNESSHTGRELPSLALQRTVARVFSPLWMLVSQPLMRIGYGWRIAGRESARRTYRELRASPGPLLVCANHLTMLDSFLVVWALGSLRFYLRDFGALPWNVPDRANFARSRWQRALAWSAKCIPISRGGDRKQVARVLERVESALGSGDAVLIFPEGGRSRTGRVEVGSAAWGVGRLVRALPGCRVLCVYLRGEGQEDSSDVPRRGERFRVAVSCFEPKSDHGGVRGSMDVSRQIVARIAELERMHFAGDRFEAPR